MRMYGEVQLKREILELVESDCGRESGEGDVRDVTAVLEREAILWNDSVER